MEEEYVRRHREISADMLAELKAAGICNYSIYKCGRDLVGTYECEKGEEFAVRYQASSPVVIAWEKAMDNVVDRLPDGEPVGTLYEPTTMQLVFRLD